MADDPTTTAIGDVTILHGDCRELIRAMPDGSVDAVVTDPPYGTAVERDGYGRRENYGGVGRAIEGDSGLDALAGMLDEAGRILKPNTWVALFCSPKRHAETASLCERAGFPVAGEVVWDKARPGLGGGIRYQHETVLLCRSGNPAGRDSLFSVIRSHVSREGKHKRHPHEKPVDVLRKLVCYASRPGELVLDPFAGSGSTLVAAMKAGRRAIGMEIDSRYIPIIERRVRDAETPLFQWAPDRSVT